MSKTYSQMTPAERIADRIAKNRAIDAKVQSAPKPEPKPVSVPRWFTPEVAQAADDIVSGKGQPVIVKCWNRDIIIAFSHAEAIRTLLSAKLAKWEAEGSSRSVRGREGWSTVSVQTAINAVRDTLRINFPTNHGEAQDVLKALGFQLERLADGHTTILIGYKEN